MLRTLTGRKLLGKFHKPNVYTNHVRFGASSAAMQSVPDQPFYSTENMQSQQLQIHKDVIIPKFWYGQDKLPRRNDEYMIDCSQFSDAINNENTTLTNTMTQKFDETGFVLLTNTGLTELQDMLKLVKILIPSEMNMEYKGGSNWRNYIEPNVYDTGAPKEAWIHFHHEMAYVSTSPESLGFCCQYAAPNKGETYVSDNVKVTEYLLSTEFGKKLYEKGICYQRNLTDKEFYKNFKNDEFDVYNHWQQSFGTDDIEEATQIAQERGLKVEWDMDNEKYGRYMMTKFYIDVFEYFEPLNMNLLYASVADHHMWFDSWPGICNIDKDERPLKISFGDDSDMTYDECKLFVDVYDRFGIPIRWNVGDIAVVCNYRWAHGRPEYSLEANEKRELGVVLGKVFERQGQK